MDPRQLTKPTPKTKATLNCNVKADCVMATGWLIQSFLQLSDFTVTKLLDSDAKISRLKNNPIGNVNYFSIISRNFGSKLYKKI